MMLSNYFKNSGRIFIYKIANYAKYDVLLKQGSVRCYSIS